MSEIYEIYMIINYCFDLHTLQQISKNSLSHFVQKRKQLKTVGHVSGLPSGKLNLLFKYKIIDNIINSIT